MDFKAPRSLTGELRSRFPERWRRVPSYRAYDRGGALRCLDSVDSVLRELGCFPDHVDALDHTVRRVEQAFDTYEGRREQAFPADRVFIVPSRMAENDPLHADEFSEAFPLMSRIYGLDSGTIRRFLSLLPPAVVCSYEINSGHQGHVVLVPVNGGLVTDLGKDLAANTVQRIVTDAAVFARDRLGARVAGLAATLPSLTRFGQTVDVPDLVTTTGHGGTVHLIKTLTRDVTEPLLGGRDPLTIGVIGAAGSIGSSTLITLQQEFPDIPFIACDRPSRLNRVLDQREHLSRTHITANVSEVFTRCRLIISAITEKLNLTQVADQIDLVGTILIDDSQPGCVTRDQWEKRGGRLLWPIGTAGTTTSPLHRENNFRYGTTAGLVHHYDLWGCEAEAAAIALTGTYDAALHAPVTPDDVQRIGELCTAINIKAAQPQSYGHPC